MSDDRKLAMFLDFENIVGGVKEAQYKAFEIKLVLERLVEKGKIMVKRAYADWNRYVEYKRPCDEHAVQLIDVPQSRYSGKNSADIRMVVDAMDLAYAKQHVDTFALVSGDSDFSPLVSKLRENDRYVIGIGVKSSSSELLVGNCDEFIFYVGAFGRTLNVQRVRLACGPQAPPCSWTLLIALATAFLRQAPSWLILPASDHDELAAVAHESRHDPAHDAHAERPQDGRPEAGDVKPLDHQGHEPEADTVQHVQEQAERDQGDRQREDQQHRAHHGVDDPEEQTRGHGGQDPVQPDAGDHRRRQHEGQDVDEHAEQEAHEHDLAF